MQLGEGEVEAGDLGEEEPYEDPEQVQVGVGNLGLHAKLHYEALVVVHPEENQRLSVPMGWLGPGREEGDGQSWLTMKKKEDYVAVAGKVILYLILSVITQQFSKQTYL